MNSSTENYTQALVRLKKTLVSSRFLRWWFGELSSMVPSFLRSGGLKTERFTVVRLEQNEAFLRLFDNGRIQDAGSVALQTLDSAAQRLAVLAALNTTRNGQKNVVLALPHDRVLGKTLTLPLATEENLNQVLEFQMEEYTPFPVSQVYFCHRVAGRDFVRGQLAVEFAAAPRNAVDEALKTLASWGCMVRAVVTEDMLAAGNPVNLLPSAQIKPISLLRQGLNPWLITLVVLLATAAMTMPLVIKREAVIQMLPWVEKGKTAAEATDALRRELEAKVNEHNYLPGKRLALPPVIVALEELTRILPDDTWVQQLDIKSKELQIQGETASSVRLIGLFEQSAIFHDASFRSPLTKGQAAGAERYQLALQMRNLLTSPVAGAAAASGVLANSGVSIVSQPSVTVLMVPPASVVVIQKPVVAPAAGPASAVVMPANKASAPAAENKP